MHVYYYEIFPIIMIMVSFFTRMSFYTIMDSFFIRMSFYIIMALFFIRMICVSITAERAEPFM